MHVKTILAPTDFSADSEKACDAAIELAKLYGASVVVLHAYHVSVPMTTSAFGGAYTMPEGFFDDIRSEAKARVEQAAKDLATDGVDVRGVAVGDPASLAIISFAESLPADLIVMGTRGISGLKHVLLGSVAERVVRSAPCPVMTVKGDR